MPEQFQPAYLGQQLLRRVKVPSLRICKESARFAIDHLEFIITEIASAPECLDTLSKCVDILRTPETPTLLRCLYRKLCTLKTATLTRVPCYLASHARGVTASFTEMRL